MQTGPSGVKSNRLGLNELLNYCREGDLVVVWRLDRLGRSLKDLIDIVGKLENKGIALKSLNESIDTSSSSEKLIFHIFGVLAEFSLAVSFIMFINRYRGYILCRS